MIRARGLQMKMTFSFQARADDTSYPLLKEMYDASFRNVFFGLETASDRLMKVVDKGETVKQCIEAVRIAKQIGFHVSATFIYGLPGETWEDRMACVKLTRQLELNMVRYNNSTPYPGTRLHKIASLEKRLFVKGIYENFNSVSTFIESPFNPIPLSYVPKGNTELRIRRDILFSYLMFYLDLNKLKRMLSTQEEGVGWFSAGTKVYDLIKKLPAILLLGLQLAVKYLQLFYELILEKEINLYIDQYVLVRSAQSLVNDRISPTPELKPAKDQQENP